jgi:hypothetical protein
MATNISSITARSRRCKFIANSLQIHRKSLRFIYNFSQKQILHFWDTAVVSLQLPHSTFWWRWLLVGLAAGAVAGTLLRTLLTLTASLQHPVLDRSGLGSNSWAVVFPANLLSAKFIVSLIVLGGVYGVCQSIAQWLALREQTPKRRRALQAHFVATILGTVLVGVLSFWLFAVGFAAWLTSLGLSIPLKPSSSAVYSTM